MWTCCALFKVKRLEETQHGSKTLAARAAISPQELLIRLGLWVLLEVSVSHGDVLYDSMFSFQKYGYIYCHDTNPHDIMFQKNLDSKTRNFL